MAVLERGFSERGLPIPSAAELNPKTASTEGRMFVELGDTGSAIAQQLEKAHLTAEEAKARNIYETAHSEILSQAAQEVDLTPEKQKVYQERLRTSLSKAADSISLQNYKDLFINKYSPKADVAEAKLNSIFLKRYRDQARSEFQKSKFIQGSNYVTTNNINEKSMYISELKSDIADQVASGYMTKEEAAKVEQRTLEEWDKNHIKNDLETRPQWLLEEAKKGEEGFYAGVNPALRSNMVEQAKKRIHSLEIINRNNTENEMMKKQIAGALTPEELEESFLNKSISRSYYEKMSKLMDSPIGPTGNTDPATFYDLTNSLIQPETTPEKAREKLLEAQADGKLSAQDFKKLYSMHLLPTEEGPQSLTNILGPKAQGDFVTIKNLHDAQQKQLTDKKNIWHSAFKFIDHTLENDQIAVTQARQKLYERMEKQGAKDPRTEAGKVLSEHALNIRPDISKASDKGIVLISNGVKRRYFKDGSYEEVGDK